MIVEENQVVTADGIGNVKIADEVVAIIAAMAATDVTGVAGMSSGIAGGIAEMLGKKNLTKGIKVDVKEKETFIDLYIVVEYGSRIPEVAWEIQEKVKNAVETMTGLSVGKVNIHIQGVNIEKEPKKDTQTKDEETVKSKQK
ncbi:Asp23/Gls24 family envelope stress response protein [Petroclostridium sp. X23]|uniref:Asp23/Gls24 family envelope stress response protein n=1 Tax=Petroclostridium sp. X23 TaxID=3045146 RepID=UPI0024AC959A|nr:Asp23/Gls24 family envelope stress response protein [Petroclostridium sp. X23]WHH59639.1 Asp23/Gls24 family envelope stress response protein [Petroclostridium sp. X23]